MAREEYTYSMEGLEEWKVPCRRCGASLTIYLQPKAPPLRIVKYCGDCRRVMKASWSDLSSYHVEDVIRLVLRNHRFDGPVFVFRPGDEGFEERATTFWKNRTKKQNNGCELQPNVV